MRCADVAALLADAEVRRSVPGFDDVVRRAIGQGWIAPAPRGDADAVDALRAEARALQARLRAAAPELREATRLALDEVRRRLFTAAEAETATFLVGDTPHVLTWRGRELLDELGPRLHRVADREVTAFVEEMDALRGLLRDLAARAAALVPRLDGVPAPAARLAAVGLAGLPDDELDERLRAFAHARSRFGASVSPEVAAACAETAAVAGVDPSAVIFDLLQRGARLDDVTLPRATVARLVEGGTTDAPAAWTALGGGTAGLERLRDLAEAVGGDREVAALIAVTRPGGVDRFRAVRDGLARLLPVKPDGLAALLVLIEAEPAEILDDLRLAAEVVVSQRLAPGGAEALSLGGKLLLVAATRGGSALLPGAKDGAHVATTGLTLPVAPERLYAALAPIHVELVQREVSRWSTSHPGHRTTYYG